MSIKRKFPCPCCGFYSLDDSPGSFGICPVCYWEDDNIQYVERDYEGGANGLSLNKARINYKNIGAISEQYLDSVRLPLEEEKPENNR